jgi:hypothetical protein
MSVLSEPPVGERVVRAARPFGWRASSNRNSTLRDVLARERGE